LTNLKPGIVGVMNCARGFTSFHKPPCGSSDSIIVKSINRAVAQALTITPKEKSEQGHGLSQSTG
jgi:hypothetical protein